MARVLRKACRACTIAKRRCIVRLPRCHRCEARGIDCLYDLEPLVNTLNSHGAGSGKHRSSQKVTNSTKHDSLDHNFLRYVSSLHMDPTRVALNFGQSPTARCLTVSKIAITADKFTVEYVTHELLKIAQSVAQDQSAIYIHAHMRPRSRPRLLKSDMASIRSVHVDHWPDPRNSLLLCDRLCRLLSGLKISKEPLPDILQAFQILMSFITSLLFTGDLNIVEPKENMLRHMREVSVRLLKDGPSMMPTNLSRWQTWILAESVRRAILMTCLIQGVYHGWLRGYCYHEVFIQALPFDVRPGLWCAGSEDEWNSLMENNNLSRSWNTWSELVSFREFADSFAKSPFDPGLDIFQRLLLTAHHGKEPVDRTLGKILT